MSNKAFEILTDISHNTLFRRQNGGPGVYMSSCLAIGGGSSKMVKICELMEKSMKDNKAELLNCAGKCKDEACNETCTKSATGVDIEVVQNLPFSKAEAECAKVANPILICIKFCKKNDLSCYEKCSDQKYTNASCISKELDISKDQVKEIIDCPEKKCSDSSDVSKLFECVAECRQPRDSSSDNKDSKNQSEASNYGDSKSEQGNQLSSPSRSYSGNSQSANKSASSCITTSNLITFGLIFLSLSFNIQ